MAVVRILLCTKECFSIYRKVLLISPGLIKFCKGFWMGLSTEELISGGGGGGYKWKFKKKIVSK